MSIMIERVAEAIAAVRLFSRYNQWTDDRVEGFPIEICRHGGEGEPEVVVIERFGRISSERRALDEVTAREQAKAAIEAMREPTDLMGHGLPSGYKAGSHSATEIWRGMIDGALNESKWAAKE